MTAQEQPRELWATASSQPVRLVLARVTPRRIETRPASHAGSTYVSRWERMGDPHAGDELVGSRAGVGAGRQYLFTTRAAALRSMATAARRKADALDSTAARLRFAAGRWEQEAAS